MDRESLAKSIAVQVASLHEHLREERVTELCGEDQALVREVQEWLVRLSNRDTSFDDRTQATRADNDSEDVGSSLGDAPTGDFNTGEVPTGLLADDSIGEISGATLLERYTDPVDRYRESQFRPDMVIGNYRIVQKLGEGGFGEVYQAKQTEPVRRDVAIKILKKGMDSKQVLARFGAERQALAMMNHSGIAKVFDAGTTDAGQSFFVMELVKGVPIARFCDQHKLDIRSRVKLFIDVCDAIQHAHQKGVIHRDIKPSNILVAGDAHKYAPVVIDFGVSKATQQPLSEDSVVTQVHQILGTPAYMSPEQAAMSSIDIDTRADLYSLGVVLYELLCGVLPLRWDNRPGVTAFEIVQIIREVEPKRPSQAFLAADPENQSKRAERRDETVRSLPKTLHSELDWIAMKCLEKDRTNRYASVSGLAADAQRYLDNDPVLAKRSTLAYSVQKFAAKNRGLVASGSVAFVLMAAALVASFFLMERLRKDRRDLLLLSDLNKLEALEDDFSGLLSHPYSARKSVISEWVERAKDPLSRIDQHKATLERLRRIELTAGLEADSRAWQFESQSQLVDKLNLFQDGDDGLLGTAADLMVRTPSSEQIAEAWKLCLLELSQAHPEWEVVETQELFPIKNSATGLWEFVDLRTGTAPPQSGKPDVHCGIQYVLLPGGTFLMGSPEGEPGRNAKREFQHEVTVSPFLIAKYEMTQGIWERMEGYKFNTDFYGPMIPTPASWYNAREFGAKINADLPTEAQWEFACRAGTTTPFSSTESLDTIAWHGGNSGGVVHGIGLKKPNSFGLFDMHGNCHEWVYDQYEVDFYETDAAKGLDPVNEPQLKTRSQWFKEEKRINAIPDAQKQEAEFANFFVVNRSGPYNGPARFCRSADRFFGKPVVNITGITFRLARTNVVRLKNSESPVDEPGNADGTEEVAKSK